MTYKNCVVTGCGRSGTRYASVLLSRLGLPCGHQKSIRSQKPGIPSSMEKPAEASAFAAPFVMDIPDTWLLIHQVRHPLKVVDSLIRLRHLPSQHQFTGHNFYKRYVPTSQGYSHLPDEALYIWMEWNRLILKASTRRNYRRHRIEDGLYPWELYSSELGLKWNLEIANSVSKTEGSGGGCPQEFEWSCFRNEKLRLDAQCFAAMLGYSS